MTAVLTRPPFYRQDQIPTGVGPVTEAEYDDLGTAGLLTPEDRVELLDGWVVEKPVKNSPHIDATRNVLEALDALALTGWWRISQDPIDLGRSQPEPDVAVIRGRRIRGRHPTAAEVGIVVEVSDSTLAFDRGRKQAIYAKAGLPVYWIINLVDDLVEVYTQPAGKTYAAKADHGRGDSVPVVLDGVEVGRIAVNDLLP